MEIAPEIDEIFYKFLERQDLHKFAPILVEESVTRVEHLEYVTDNELASYGLSSPAIRRLRAALLNHFNVDKPSPSEPTTPQPLPRKKYSVSQELPPDEPIHNNSVDLKIQTINEKDIKLKEVIVDGKFAIFAKGKWQKNNQEKVTVMLKKIKNPVEKEEMIKEINLMLALNHPNLMQFHGIVLTDPIFILTEHCDGGRLRQKLKHENKHVLLATQLVDFSKQIASGMAYLEERNYVHRFLAIGNIWLTNNDQQIKIGNFDLSKLSNPESLKMFRNAWNPPEVLKFQQFSSSSDVWSFGVTLWELWTNAAVPWSGYHSLEIMKALENGERLQKSEHTPNQIYDVLLACWELDPKERPSFKSLHDSLSKIDFQTLQIKTDSESVPSGFKFIVLDERQTSIFGQKVSTGEYCSLTRSYLNSKNVSFDVITTEKTRL